MNIFFLCGNTPLVVSVAGRHEYKLSEPAKVIAGRENLPVDYSGPATQYLLQEFMNCGYHKHLEISFFVLNSSVMKPAYVLYACLLLIGFTACKEEVTEAPDLSGYNLPYVVPEQPQEAAISLDSFQRSTFYSMQNGCSETAPATRAWLVKRDKDSLTISGSVQLARAEANHTTRIHTYRFYFKSSDKGSYAYLNFLNHSQTKASNGFRHTYASMETAYHLDFNGLNRI